MIFQERTWHTVCSVYCVHGITFTVHNASPVGDTCIVDINSGCIQRTTKP